MKLDGGARILVFLCQFTNLLSVWIHRFLNVLSVYFSTVASRPTGNEFIDMLYLYHGTTQTTGTT